MSKHSRDYIELAHPWSSLRLCRALEKKFPDLRGCQLGLMKYLCSDVCTSEDYLDCWGDAWRRTTIFLDSESNPHHVFSGEGTECKEMARIMELSSNERDTEWKKLMEGLVVCTDSGPSKVEIRSNILPGGAYLERIRKLELQELEPQSFWTIVRNRMLGTSCSISKRGFFPMDILEQACKTGNVSLMEKVNEWRVGNGGRCSLAKGLEDTKDKKNKQAYLTPRKALEKVPIGEVVESALLGVGNEGAVHQVLWRNRTYARKSCTISFKTEQDVALRVLHPHVATAFGCSANGGVDVCSSSVGDFLFMERMTGSLFRLTIEKDVSEIKLPLSRVESLDVLLQVGMAMDHMHTKNVVHGDIKPHNILISPFEVSENERYLLTKITDFDCAQFITSPGQDLRLQGPIGTTQYAAPEVLSLHDGLKGETDFKCSEKIDVYSFGVVAYEVLTGHAPVLISMYDRERTQDDKRRVIKGKLRLRDSKEWKKLITKCRYPVELIELVEKCWELNPEKRLEFSKILPIIKECKSTVQRWEKLSSDIWNRSIFIAVCLIAFICYFIL